MHLLHNNTLGNTVVNSFHNRARSLAYQTVSMESAKYLCTAHAHHTETDRQTDGRTDGQADK